MDQNQDHLFKANSHDMYLGKPTTRYPSHSPPRTTSHNHPVSLWVFRFVYSKRAEPIESASQPQFTMDVAGAPPNQFPHLTRTRVKLRETMAKKNYIT